MSVFFKIIYMCVYMCIYIHTYVYIYIGKVFFKKSIRRAEQRPVPNGDLEVIVTFSSDTS